MWDERRRASFDGLFNLARSISDLHLAIRMKPYTVQGNLISPQFAEQVYGDKITENHSCAVVTEDGDVLNAGIPNPPTHGNVIVMHDNQIIVNSVEPPSDCAS